MTRKPVLILDVDGVIRNIIPAIVRCYNRSVPFPIKESDIRTYDLDFIPDKHAFFTRHGEEIFRNSPMFPETKQALEILSENFDITYATAQYEENEGYTVDWFESHGLDSSLISFVWDKKIHNGEVFVDDCPANLKGHPAQICFLFDAVYNRNCTDYPRVYSLFHLLYNLKTQELI